MILPGVLAAPIIIGLLALLAFRNEIDDPSPTLGTALLRTVPYSPIDARSPPRGFEDSGWPR